MSTSAGPKKSLLRALGVVSSATALSRVLGLVREQVIAWYFGAGVATDAFVAAFRIPNLLRDLFAEGALSSAFVPVFKEQLVKESAVEAFRLANIVITALMIVTGLIVLAGIIVAPGIVYVMAPGFAEDGAKFALTVALTRIMFVFLTLVSIGAVVMAVLNSFGKFGVPALASSLFNVGSIIPVLLFFSYTDQPAYLLAIGVVIGGLAQLFVQWPLLRSLGFRFRFTFGFVDESFRRMLKLMGPMLIGLSAGRINILISTFFASYLGPGALAYLNFAFRLMHFPMGVFAVALGTVTLPRVSELIARGETDELESSFRQSMTVNLILVIPSMFFFVFMGKEIVSLLFEWGAFTAVDTQVTALVLLHYAYGIIGFASVRVLTPYYYAQNDARRPMYFSIISVIVNTLLYYPFIKLIGVAGLAAATSAGGLVNALLLLLYLPSKGVPVRWGQLVLETAKISLAAAIAFGGVRIASEGLVPEYGGIGGRLVSLFVPATAASLAFLVLGLLFRIDAMLTVIRRLLRR